MVAVKTKVCYISVMNKDVIYIEPEEDITDIITKIEGSKSKIVALVPPKKAGVFRSIVNIKLIAKTAHSLEKSVVFVTTDPSIIKLAAATKMPVTKDLQTVPKIPDAEDVEEVDEADTEEEVEVDDEAEEEEKEEEKKPVEKKEVKVEKVEDEEEEEDEEDEDEEEEEEEKKPAKKEGKKSAKKDNLFTKLAKSDNPALKWIGTHPKIVIGSGVGLIFFIIFMIWAFGIAPAAIITAEVKTQTGSFSESVSFTEKLEEEKVEEGKFFIEEKKVEEKTELEFEATGEKNVGEKASGDLTVSYWFPVIGGGGTIAIKAGTVFTNSSLNFLASADASIHWDGDVTSAAQDCENYKKGDISWMQDGCKVSTKVSVVAAESGVKYNVAGGGGWSTSIAGLAASSSAAMAGGSDKTVTVVQQSDIDKALNGDPNDTTKKETDDDTQAVIKAKLEDLIAEDEFTIESSFKVTFNDPVSSPAVGEEVQEGKKAKLTVTTTATVFVLDETKLKEFIKTKAKLDDGQKIYEMKNPFIENFLKTDSGYLGKLKTSYVSGSTVTENDIVDVAKGKGTGTAKRDLEAKFEGVKFKVEGNLPWVSGVPTNVEKITVNINTQE